MIDYNTARRKMLDLYKNQPPQQARLYLPLWAMDMLVNLSVTQYRSIMAEIDQLAASHGLLTPTKIILIRSDL